MMPTTARSSTRVKAAQLRSVSVKLAELLRVLMCEGFKVRRCECSFEGNVLGLAGAGINKITDIIHRLKIYFVNTSLQSKY
jgi:Trm5-related predicted tRNA methylase